MKTLFKKISFLVVATFIINGCSSDDDKNINDDDGIITGFEVFQAQIVSVELSQEIHQSEYTATLGEVTINVVRKESNKLLFMVPSDFPLGITQLHISELAIDISYFVKPGVLNGSSEAAIAPFFDEINIVFQEIETEQTEQALYLKHVITSFESYYETLSQEEKNQMALFYQTNAALFNSILNPDFAEGRWADINTTLLKHKVAVLAFGGGVAVAWLSPSPIDKSIGSLIAIIAWEKSKDYLNELMESKLRTIDFNFNAELPKSQKSFSAASITFESGISKNISLAVERRDLQTSDYVDEESIFSGLVTFFGSHSVFSEAIDKLNTVIQFVNDNIFFSNIGLIPVYTMPEQSEPEAVLANNDYLQNITFWVEDENIQLLVGNISDTGNLSLRFTISNPNDISGNSVFTSLNYTYRDDFSDFSGSIPIEVGKNEEYNIFTDAIAIKAILAANSINVSNPYWDSDVVSEVISVLQQNGASINYTVNRVQGLNWEYKDLTVILPEIGNITNLVNLSLGFNQLTGLPETIGNLSNLQSLGLTYNQLTSIPESVGNLTGLTNLGLHDNQLTGLPESIGNLVNLSHWSLYNNKLTSLPSSIGNLVNLTSLSLSNNQLSILPYSIGSLINLESLLLNQNQLVSLPESIGNLTNLTGLSLYDNQLTSVPSSIGNLTNLTALNLSNNQLTSLPSSVGNLVNLTALMLSVNQLSSVSSSISNLINLTRLELGSNQLTSVPSSIGNLINLTQLELGNNQLTSVSFVGSLVNLTYLSLFQNQLTSIPSSVGNLTALTILYVDNNELNCLPQSVWNLTNTGTSISWYGNSYSQYDPVSQQYQTYGLCSFGDTDCSDAPCE